MFIMLIRLKRAACACIMITLGSTTATTDRRPGDTYISLCKQPKEFKTLDYSTNNSASSCVASTDQSFLILRSGWIVKISALQPHSSILPIASRKHFQSVLILLENNQLLSLAKRWEVKEGLNCDKSEKQMPQVALKKTWN